MKKLFKLLLPIFLVIGSLASSGIMHANDDIAKAFRVESTQQGNQYEIALVCQDKVIGSITYHQPIPGCWKIKEVYVEKILRNHGLGTLLITQCINHISSVGFEKIELDVMPIDPIGPSLEKLIQFYTNLFNKLTPTPLYTLSTILDEECPWLAMVTMVITKNNIAT